MCKNKYGRIVGLPFDCVDKMKVGHWLSMTRLPAFGRRETLTGPLKTYEHKFVKPDVENRARVKTLFKNE